MLMLPAGKSELRKAFHQHISLAKNGTSPSHYLLLFYAVECGLKSIYLHRMRVKTTSDISDETLRGSHDLMRWVKAKELRLPAFISGTSISFRLRRDKSSWSISYAHQAWRYGVAIAPADEQRLVHWLEKVYEWIKENIRRDS